MNNNIYFDCSILIFCKFSPLSTFRNRILLCISKCLSLSFFFSLMEKIPLHVRINFISLLISTHSFKKLVQLLKSAIFEAKKSNNNKFCSNKIQKKFQAFLQFTIYLKLFSLCQIYIIIILYNTLLRFLLKTVFDLPLSFFFISILLQS